MYHSLLWTYEAEGFYTAELYGLRLAVVSVTIEPGLYRYQVLRPLAGEDTRIPVSSGHSEDLKAACEAAEAAALRLCTEH